MSVTIAGESRVRILGESRVQISESERVRVYAGDVVYINESGDPAPGGMLWDPIETAVADNATVTMVQPGAAYIIPRKSGNNRALLDCTDLLASPGVPALVVGAAATQSNANGTTTYGPSVYVPVDQPGWLADLSSLYAAVTVTDYSGSPCSLVFTAPSVTITLDQDYGTALAVLQAIAAAFTGTSSVVSPVIIQDVSGGGPYTSALRTTATGDAAVFTFNAGASTAGELTDWFENDATYIDGWSDYPVGLGGKNIGTGELGASTTTHLWTDDMDMDYVHYAEIVSLDGATIQATSYKFRPESLSFSPTDTGDWPEYDFGDTPANFNVAQALDILAARSTGTGGSGDLERAVRRVTAAATAAGTDGVIVLAGSGGYALTLPTTGFDDGQAVEVWGAAGAACTIESAADLFPVTGGSPVASVEVAANQVVKVKFYTTVDNDPAWRVTYDSTAAGGSGDVVGPASVTDGVPALFDGTTGKLLKAGATNTANGLVKLDGSGTIPDSLHPASIARDTEITSAVSDHVAATDPHGDQAYANSTFVAKSLFDANTILAANSDDTPAAVTVAEQRIVGRVTGGNITALTAAQVLSLLGVGWVTVSDTTVSNSGSGVASISVSCSGYRKLRVWFRGRSLKSTTTTDTLNMTFNSDTGSVYSKNNAAAGSAFVISSSFTASNTNTNRQGGFDLDIDCGQSSYTTFRLRTTSPSSTATTAGSTDWPNGLYLATTAISSIQFAFAGGNIAGGSSLVVEGLA